ncbi:hypothetical protein C8J57DRAFT_1433033 [Mycena rebaudengoi]|nr:hypothetical protein C8J57DRAFT_1433033 [Mycena rebaudengoi]
MLETLPVEIIAQIVGELSIKDAVKISQLSRRLRLVSSDPILNVWRVPIIRNLLSNEYEETLKNLGVFTVVPRHNWVDILSLGNPHFILFEATLPNLKDAEYEESFKRRFLPSWKKWRRDGTWKAAFLKTLHQTWHRSCTPCTANEAWTKYIVLNRNGSANLLKLHQELVVQLADVRILALGTLNRPRSPLTVNPNAKLFLQPPGPSATRMRYPLPAQTHTNYPFHTPGAAHKRRLMEEGEGLQWVGGMMIVAQILGAGVGKVAGNCPPPLDQDLIVGSGRQQYASITWDDLFAIAPWLEETITRQIDGPGLGI